MGIGAGMFQTYYQIQKHIVSFPVPLDTALHPHNIFLTTWLSGGILGLSGLLGVIYWAGKKVVRGLQDQKNALWYGVLGAALLIILVHGLVDTTYWKNDLAFMWWIILGFLCTHNSSGGR